jgi:8-oxo-dGTP pyrophosphatase MutT (NUDIX family)
LNIPISNSPIIDEAFIKEALNLKYNLQYLSYPQDGLRAAAVLIPLISLNGSWHLLYTRRTEIVQDHKGQVSFPGGGVENGEDPVTAALREAHEEIGLHPRDVVVLGEIAPMPTVSNYLITPIVGKIPYPYTFKLSKIEVDRIFTIPLLWLAEPSNHYEKLVTHRNNRVDNVIFFNNYDNELLWGITARITLDFLNIIGL